METPIAEKTSSESKTIDSKENVSVNLSQMVSICAAGLFVSFFLPWINFLGLKPSLFDAAKEGGGNLLYWALPLFSALTIFAGITKNSQKVVAQLTGAIPFFVLGHSLYSHGQDFMRILAVGAWFGLALGLVLFLLARRLK